jgi:hypothetical protein
MSAAMPFKTPPLICVGRFPLLLQNLQLRLFFREIQPMRLYYTQLRERVSLIMAISNATEPYTNAGTSVNVCSAAFATAPSSHVIGK